MPGDWEIDAAIVVKLFEMEDKMDIEIRKLGIDTKDDFLKFFDKDAFSDNPEWDGCYCQFYLDEREGLEWNGTAEGNRLNAARRIEEGSMTGLLAYHEGKTVGWCHVNFKKNVAVYKEGASDKAAIIMCYVIAPDMRRRGLASMLLDEAVSMMKEAGAETIEAYPMKNPKVKEHNYHGFLEMYLAKGFKVEGEDEHTKKVVLNL